MDLGKLLYTIQRDSVASEMKLKTLRGKVCEECIWELFQLREIPYQSYWLELTKKHSIFPKFSSFHTCVAFYLGET